MDNGIFLTVKTNVEFPNVTDRCQKNPAVETESTTSDLTNRRKQSFWDRRQWIPAYKEAAEAGQYRVGPGSGNATDWISQDRDKR